jgi:hypothetical protein
VTLDVLALRWRWMHPAERTPIFRTMQHEGGRGMTEPKTCAVAICDEPRIAGREYCAKHGPARGWTAPQPATPAQGSVSGSETGVQAGWYSDPLSSAAQRYWDGSTWTKRIRAAKKHPTAPWPGTDRPTVPADVVAHNRKLNIIIGSVAAGVVLIIVIAVVANSGGKSKSGGGGGNSATGFVSKIEQNSRATASDVTALINELLTMPSIEKRQRDGKVSWRAHYRTPEGAAAQQDVHPQDRRGAVPDDGGVDEAGRHVRRPARSR